MATTRTLQLETIVDLSPFAESGELVALNVGPDDRVYAVIALRELDYRVEKRGASFAKTIPDLPQAYRVLAFHDGSERLDIQIAQEPFNIHDVQPLPKDRILLVCCRSHYRGVDDFDRNGRVYSSDGKLVREILLGDGIENVQTTTSGKIWTSYFDEGVFGSYGWIDPVGAPGLIAWNPSGKKLYEFSPSQGLDFISDCYAMNVASDSDIWIYYYTEFPLVHLRDGEVVSFWPSSVNGSRAFAIESERVLFAGSYDDRDAFQLFELARGRARKLTQFSLLDEAGKAMRALRVIGRRNALYALHNDRIYRCSIQDASNI